MFSVPHSFSTVLRSSGPVFMFYAVPRSWGPIFMFYAPGLAFGGIEGVGSHFHVLCASTRCWLYRGRRLPFSYFARSNWFSAVPMASAPIFIFALPDTFSAVRRALVPVIMCCAPGLFFDGSKGVGSNFHVLRTRTIFRQYQGRRFPFSFIALPDSFPEIPRASGPVFMFCPPKLVSGGTEGVRSHF
jgi:hypothetical protein